MNLFSGVVWFANNLVGWNAICTKCSWRQGERGWSDKRKDLCNLPTLDPKLLFHHRKGVEICHILWIWRSEGHRIWGRVLNFITSSVNCMYTPVVASPRSVGKFFTNCWQPNHGWQSNLFYHHWKGFCPCSAQKRVAYNLNLNVFLSQWHTQWASLIHLITHSYIIFVSFAPQTWMLSSFLLHTKVRKSRQIRYLR